MNMLELQLLVVISGVPERRTGPTLIDSQQGLVADRLVPAPKLSASSDRLPPQSP